MSLRWWPAPQSEVKTYPPMATVLPGLQALPTLLRAGRDQAAAPGGDRTPAPAASPPSRESARPLMSPHPIYPRQARLMGWEGTVILRLLVDTQGYVAKVTLVTGSGFALLDESQNS